MGGTPDFSKEAWHCNICDEDFEINAEDSPGEGKDWPRCPECNSDSTDML